MMLFLRVAAYGAAILSLAGAPAAAAITPRQAIESRAYLIGEWTCSFTAGPDSGTYRTTWSSVLDGMWLKQTYDQPAQPHAHAFRAEYLVGYDERHGAWVRFGAMTTGQYFAIRMTDTGDGWGWKYASLFGNNRTSGPQYDATFRRTSDGSYRIDGPTYPGPTGAELTEHHVCRKSG